MTDDLESMDERLGALERAVAQAYRAYDDETAATPFVRIPVDATSRFRAELEPLKAALFSSGKPGTLRLVSELHDAIRIRMIYVDQLLTHDVPRPYVEQALRDYADVKPGPAAPTAEPARMRSTAAVPGDGLFAAVRNFFAALFGRDRSATQAPRLAKAPPATPTQRVQGPITGHREPALRLIYLHKLMEEDHRHLLTEAQRPPRIADGVTIPAYIANFSARDFAENHFAVRPNGPAGAIARTPEELRAKLAKRSQTGGRG